MDREGLADFLRRRRAALHPDDVGLGPTRRRRTPGLRREEVAALAYISTDFYTRLEQGRGSRPSAQTVASIARALRLTVDERDHLMRLAGHEPPPHGRRSEHVSPALMLVLDKLDTPAQVVNDLGVTLRQNALAAALLGVETEYQGLARSTFYRWFTDPDERRRFPDEDRISRSYVSNLREVIARDPDDAEARELVEALQVSPEFRALWEQHQVGRKLDTSKRVAHPEVGLMTLDCQILTAENQTEKLVVFTATPGSEDAEKLALLGVIGTYASGSA
jgi:transcriptional regulator with XRE-family HTH domain